MGFLLVELFEALSRRILDVCLHADVAENVVGVVRDEDTRNEGATVVAYDVEL